MKSISKTPKLRTYLQVTPLGLGSGMRLYYSYFASLLARIIIPTKKYHVEDFIPGRSPLTVRVLNTVARIRPRSEDLYVMTAAYEPITNNWFKVEPGSIVLDVGAHIGHYALMAAPRARLVIAIEADPSNFSILKNNIALNRFTNIIPLRIGVSKKSGKSTIYVASKSSGSTSSLEKKWLENYADARAIEISCETLDYLTDSLRLKRVDWLKIDVEGHEVSVLEGAPKTLSGTNHLVIEISAGNEERCMKLTRDAGLELAGIGESYGRATNWFFVRRSVRD